MRHVYDLVSDPRDQVWANLLEALASLSSSRSIGASRPVASPAGLTAAGPRLGQFGPSLCK
jgi:hypothetical protein